MRVPRFRVRTLMITIGIAACALGLDSARRKQHASATRIAAYHAKREADYRLIDGAALDSAMGKRREIEFHSRRKLEALRPWWSRRPVTPLSCNHPR
jgi:hypothetical protein